MIVELRRWDSPLLHVEEEGRKGEGVAYEHFAAESLLRLVPLSAYRLAFPSGSVRLREEGEFITS